MNFQFRLGFGKIYRSCFSLSLALLLFSFHANGQEQPTQTSEIQELKALLLQQQKLLQQQQETLRSLQERLAQLESSSPSALRTPLAIPATAPVPVPVAPQQAAIASGNNSESREKRWYERFNVRGYAQFRYNRLLETNPDLECDQCDASIGSNGGLFVRRARIVLSGDINDRLSIYFQPDFGASVGGTGLHFGQIRDLYFDVNLDKKKEFRIRVGQSKVPFGFENLQSSSNRLALDRADATNSAVVNERDLGIYLMYAPEHIRKRFAYLVDSGLKGSGDYGVLAAGFYNGQNANRPEANNNLHRVVRLTYPFQLKSGRIIEPGIQAYTGSYTVPDRGTGVIGPSSFLDRRAAATLVIYPQRLGFQAEYNFGRGPIFNPLSRTIETRGLQGGYAQIMYRMKLGGHALIPYIKTQYYHGGKKYEFDARRYIVRDQELGVEWLPNRGIELVGAYAIADRTYEDSRRPNNRQKGNLLRLQLQFNY